MHELSIAISIVESAEEAARTNQATMISKVEVEIGSMAGVETEALLFAWDAAVQGTMAQGCCIVSFGGPCCAAVTATISKSSWPSWAGSATSKWSRSIS